MADNVMNIVDEIVRFVSINSTQEISAQKAHEIMLNNKYHVSKKSLELLEHDLNARGVVVVGNLYSSEVEPFNFAQINMDLKPITLQSICDRLEEGEIELHPSYQRNLVWDSKKKSRLIESIFLNIPLPTFYVDATNPSKWEVIDGLQRLNAIKEFFVDKTLVLKDLEFLKYNGLTCDLVPQSYIRRSKERVLAFIHILPGTDERVKYSIFERINTGGTVLNQQEIRNALSTEPTRRMLKDMGSNDYLGLIASKSVKSNRMLGEELALRFVAFKTLGFINYSNYESYESFLSRANQNIGNMSESERLLLCESFGRSLEVNYKIFGKLTFRKIDNNNGKRVNQLNKGLFDTFAVIVSELSSEQCDLLIERRNELIDSLIRALDKNHSGPRLSTYISSGSYRSVVGRFTIVRFLIDEVLGND